MLIRDFLDRLEGVRQLQRGEWMAKCPAHEDKNGSLHVTEKDGGILCCCFAGCSFDDITGKLGIARKDFPFPDKGNRKPVQKDWHYGCTLEEYARDRLYDIAVLKHFHLSDFRRVSKNGKANDCIRIPYLDEKGSPLKDRFRMMLKKDPEEKFTRFIWSDEGNPLPLYGLWNQPEDKKYVILVEGESDCHALWSAGLVALGVPGASNFSEQRHQGDIEQYRTIYIHLEKDSGGLTMWNRFTGEDGRHAPNALLDKMEFFCLPGEYKDPSEMWKKLDGNAADFVIAMRKAVANARTFDKFVKPAAWKSQQKTKGKEFPPGKARTSAENGSKGPAESHQKGGRPSADYTGLADEYYRKNLLRDGMPTLRFWRGQWYRYDGGCYRRQIDADERARAMRFLQDAEVQDRYRVQASENALKNMMANLQSFSYCGIPAELPVQTWIGDGKSASEWLPMSNKIVNVEKLSLYEDFAGMTEEELAGCTLPLTPDLLVTNAMEYPFDPTAKCPKFLAWLESTLPDPEVRIAAQMMFGLMIRPDTSYNVCFFLEGQGGTGKSTYLELLRAYVGGSNCCRVPLLKFEDKFATWPLAENLVNIVGEMATDDPQGKLRYIEGDFKDSVSGGNVHVEHKGKDPCAAPCIARHVFATNHLPTFFDKSEGIWDRLVIIPFTQRFRGTSSEVRNIAKEIIGEELPGIFIWALRGLRMLREAGARFPEPAACAAVKAVHRAKCDVEGTYLRRCYEESNCAETSVCATYEHFVAYLSKAGLSRRSLPTFTEAVLRVFPGVTIKQNLDYGDSFVGLKANVKLTNSQPPF